MEVCKCTGCKKEKQCAYVESNLKAIQDGRYCWDCLPITGEIRILHEIDVLLKIAEHKIRGCYIKEETKELLVQTIVSVQDDYKKLTDKLNKKE